MAAKRGDDVGDGVPGIALVDPTPVEPVAWTRRRLDGVCGQCGVDTVGDDRVVELGELVVRHEVVGEAHGDGVGRVERCARQRGVMTRAAPAHATG